MRRDRATTELAWGALLASCVLVLMVSRMRADRGGRRRRPRDDTGSLRAEAVGPARRSRSRLFRIGMTCLLCGAFGLVTSMTTWAAFNDTGLNANNFFIVGTVDIDDNDNSGFMLGLTNAVPGNSDTSCIKVSFAGTLSSSVRLYGTTTGTGLDQYLTLTVTRGVYTPSEPAFDSCTNFSADGTNYIGGGNGVIYNGTLQAFPDNYAAGLVDPTSGSPEVWSTNESHVYRFVVTLQNNTSAAGKNATQAFTWEARNN